MDTSRVLEKSIPAGPGPRPEGSTRLLPFIGSILSRTVTLYFLLSVSFFGSLAGAAAFYAPVYRWSDTVMSTLASPRDNAHGYWIASTGLALSGLWLILLGRRMGRKLSPWAPGSVRWATLCWELGALLLTLSALIVPGHYRILGFGHTHEHLAQFSGTAFYLALLLYFPALLNLPTRLAWQRRLGLVIIVAPMLSFGLNRLLVLGGGSLFPRAFSDSVKATWWSHLAYWEWTGAITLYLYLGWVLFSWREEKGSG